MLISKGTRFDQDQNSAFEQTGLGEWLRQHQVRRIFVGGLALDVCVYSTVLDGLKAGFEMHLIRSATRPVSREGGERALQEMHEKGCRIIDA